MVNTMQGVKHPLIPLLSHSLGQERTWRLLVHLQIPLLLIHLFLHEPLRYCHWVNKEDLIAVVSRVIPYACILIGYQCNSVFLGIIQSFTDKGLGVLEMNRATG